MRRERGAALRERSRRITIGGGGGDRSGWKSWGCGRGRREAVCGRRVGPAGYRGMDGMEGGSLLGVLCQKEGGVKWWVLDGGGGC